RLVEDHADAAGRADHRGQVADVTAKDREPAAERRCEPEVSPRAAREIVENPDTGAVGEESFDQVRADEARAARHENHAIHAAIVPPCPRRPGAPPLACHSATPT